MPLPFVSVLMPVYNGIACGRGYLEKAVASIVLQEYDGPIELIVVDDGSTDTTYASLRSMETAISREFLSRRLVVVRTGHFGVTPALNSGLLRCNGEFIARSDADDYSAPERIQRQVQFLLEHPDIGLLGTSARIVRGTKVGEVGFKCNNPITRDTFLTGNPFCHGSVMFRKVVIATVGGYNTEYQHSQDYDYFWRVSKSFGTHILDDPLYFYRIHPKRITSTPSRYSLQVRCAKRIKQQILRDTQ